MQLVDRRSSSCATTQIDRRQRTECREGQHRRWDRGPIDWSWSPTCSLKRHKVDRDMSRLGKNHFPRCQKKAIRSAVANYTRSKRNEIAETVSLPFEVGCHNAIKNMGSSQAAGDD